MNKARHARFGKKRLTPLEASEVHLRIGKTSLADVFGLGISFIDAAGHQHTLVIGDVDTMNNLQLVLQSALGDITRKE